MKQKIFSVIGVLAVLISAAVLITGCKQADNGTNVNKELEGGVFLSCNNDYYYFSGGKEYNVYRIASGWKKLATGRTYQGNVINNHGETVTVTVDASGIKFPKENELNFWPRVTDMQIIIFIKSLPVSEPEIVS